MYIWIDLPGPHEVGKVLDYALRQRHLRARVIPREMAEAVDQRRPEDEGQLLTVHRAHFLQRKRNKNSSLYVYISIYKHYSVKEKERILINRTLSCFTVIKAFVPIFFCAKREIVPLNYRIKALRIRRGRERRDSNGPGRIFPPPLAINPLTML